MCPLSVSYLDFPEMLLQHMNPRTMCAGRAEIRSSCATKPLTLTLTLTLMGMLTVRANGDGLAGEVVRVRCQSNRNVLKVFELTSTLGLRLPASSQRVILDWSRCLVRPTAA